MTRLILFAFLIQVRDTDVVLHHDCGCVKFSNIIQARGRYNSTTLRQLPIGLVKGLAKKFES